MILMGVETKHLLPHQLFRSLFNNAATGIAIQNGKWKISLLQGSAHALIFTRGHQSVKDKSLGAATDTAEKCSDQRLFGPDSSQRLFAQFILTGRLDPQSCCGFMRAAPK